MGRDDPLKGLIADGELPATLAPCDSQLQECTDPLGVLRVALAHLVSTVVDVRTASFRLLERDVVQVSVLVDIAATDTRIGLVVFTLTRVFPKVWLND